jgi:hypothetical protein
MALPIIVPAWEFDLQDRFQNTHALPSKRLPPRPIRILRPLNAAGTETREPTERELLITRWCRIANVYSPTPFGRKATASIYNPLANDTESADCGVSLLVTCEWLLRKRFRQEWALLDTAKRAQVLTLVKRFKTEAPIFGATELATDAAAWTLFAMYWCGASHPAALFKESLHPPTGLVRWISQFHIDQQRNQVREIQEQFAHYLGVTRGRCDVLVRRMLKRTGSLALLRELCDF